jgi:hypothetical protein
MKHLKVELSTWLTSHQGRDARAYLPICWSFLLDEEKSKHARLTHQNYWMKKSQNMLVQLTKMVLAQHFCTRGKGW